MKDETFRAKEKHVQRMTRDGLIEENAVTGEQVNAGTRPREERFGSKKADAEPKISRSKRYFKEQEAPKGASSASEKQSPLRIKRPTSAGCEWNRSSKSIPESCTLSQRTV